LIGWISILGGKVCLADAFVSLLVEVIFLLAWLTEDEVDVSAIGVEEERLGWSGVAYGRRRRRRSRKIRRGARAGLAGQPFNLLSALPSSILWLFTWQKWLLCWIVSVWQQQQQKKKKKKKKRKSEEETW
jgi:hypothetical protein